MNSVTAIVLILLGFVALTELVMFGLAFVFADEIECNLLWCTFTTVRSEHDCFVNGERVNCSDIVDTEHFCSNGRCELNGVVSPEDFFE